MDMGLLCVWFSLLYARPGLWSGSSYLNNTRVLMTITYYVTTVNSLLNFLLMRPLCAAGIVLATTFIALFFLVYLGVVFYKNSV